MPNFPARSIKAASPRRGTAFLAAPGRQNIRRTASSARRFPSESNRTVFAELKPAAGIDGFAVARSEGDKIEKFPRKLLPADGAKPLARVAVQAENEVALRIAGEKPQKQIVRPALAERRAVVVDEKLPSVGGAENIVMPGRKEIEPGFGGRMPPGTGAGQFFPFPAESRALEIPKRFRPPDAHIVIAEQAPARRHEVIKKF